MWLVPICPDPGQGGERESQVELLCQKGKEKTFIAQRIDMFGVHE
jgi:hypothetical protein